MQKQRVKPGDILEIPLPNGTFVYGKIFRDASIGVYDLVTSARPTLPIVAAFRFVVGVYKDLVTSGRWPRIGHEPFSGPDDEWPPPMSIHDPVSGGWSVYHRGEVRRISESEAASLEPAAVWDEEHILQRILRSTPN